MRRRSVRKVSPIDVYRSRHFFGGFFILHLISLAVTLIVVVVGVYFAFINYLGFSPYSSVPRDVSIQDLRVATMYDHQMKVNHPYIISLSLTSTRGLLSTLPGTLGGKSGLLNTLLLPQGCVKASLVANASSFAFQPTDAQEYSLQQDSISWQWSLTPLHTDGTAQTISFSINFTGKSHCGNITADNEYGGTKSQDSLWAKIRQNSTVRETRGYPFRYTCAGV